MFTFAKSRGNSSVGRASASQAESRGFEPRLPLKKNHKEQVDNLFVFKVIHLSLY